MRRTKKQIIRTALIDLGVEADNSKTLYQLMHMLEKVILNILSEREAAEYIRMMQSTEENE